MPGYTNNNPSQTVTGPGGPNLIPPANAYKKGYGPKPARAKGRRQSRVSTVGASSYTEKLMAAGEWTLQLSPDTPRSTLERVLDQWFGYVIITPTQLDPAIGFDGLVARARFTGIYRRRAPEKLRTLSGASIAVLLGDEDQRGVIWESGFDATHNFADFVNTRILGSNRGQGIVTGTVGGAGAGTKTCRIMFGQTPREVLDYVCQVFKCEWRVNPNFTLDAGPQANLYNTAGRLAVVDRGGGNDLATAGILANIEATGSVEHRSERVVVKADNGQIGTAWVDTFVEPNYPQYWTKVAGLPVRWTIGINNGNAPDGVAAFDVADNQLAKVREPRFSVEVSSGQYEIGRWFGVGDVIGVYAPDLRVFDMTNPKTYRGETIWPRKIRCLGRSTPITHRHGVYFASFDNAGAATITPLHRWVETNPDDETTIEVGQWRRRFAFPGRGRNLVV